MSISALLHRGWLQRRPLLAILALLLLGDLLWTLGRFPALDRGRIFSAEALPPVGGAVLVLGAGVYGDGEPTQVLEAKNRDWLATGGIAQALDALDPRSRRIVEERWLKVNDDASGGMTLHDLAAEYGVSAERIRQIEVAALKKMRKALETA